MSHMLFQKQSSPGYSHGESWKPQGMPHAPGIQRVEGDRTMGTWAMEGKGKKGKCWDQIEGSKEEVTCDTETLRELQKGIGLVQWWYPIDQGEKNKFPFKDHIEKQMILKKQLPMSFA